MRITDIQDSGEAMSEATKRWMSGNDSGDGYDPAEGEFDLAIKVCSAASDDEVDVHRMPDGREVAVGDANGPWAVDITESE